MRERACSWRCPGNGRINSALKKPLFAFFLRSLPNFADAEDLTQKTFVRLHGSVSRYQPKAKFSTWLFTIARNLLIDELKRRKRRPQEVGLEDFNSFGSTEGTAKGEWEEVLNVEIKNYLKTIDPPYFFVFSRNGVIARLPIL